jgi:hypothetical protein
MRAVPLADSPNIPIFNSFLAYVQRFDFVMPSASSTPTPQKGPRPDHATQMLVLKRSTRADGTRMGDVIPLSHLRTPAHLIPRFSNAADTRLTKESCLEYSKEFFLNKFFDKCMYYSLEGC